MKKLALTVARVVLIKQRRRKPDWNGLNNKWKKWGKGVQLTLYLRNFNSKEVK